MVGSVRRIHTKEASMATTNPESAAPTMDVRETSVLVRFTPKNASSEQYNETIRRHQTRGERLVCRRST
jgi:hypothetical protein